jgi:hypothetical protein
VEIGSTTKTIGIGLVKLFSFCRPDVRMLRKSKPFWSVLSDYGIFNCVIRVPISFPPERLRGVQLSAICVPDLRGTQGTFSQYKTREKSDDRKTGGDTFAIACRTVQFEAVRRDGPMSRDCPPRGHCFRLWKTSEGGEYFTNRKQWHVHTTS